MHPIDVNEARTVPADYAEMYHRHQQDLRSRIRTGLERRALRRGLALAGYPQTLLDLPCGTGRFWPTLAACSNGELLAADIDGDMLNRAQRELPEDLTDRMRTFRVSAFSIGLPDDSVDAVVSMRFFHHLARPEDRLRALGEMARVARHAVIASLWTDCSLSAWWQEPKSRRNLMMRQKGYGRRVCIPARLFEWESRQCGVEPIGHVDVLPGLAKWRLYALGVPRRPATLTASGF